MGVRERLERQERLELEDKLDHVRPTSATTKLQGSTGSSTRERAERQATQAIDEKPNKSALRFAGLVESVPTVGTVRQRLELAADIERDKVAPTTAATEHQKLVSHYYSKLLQREAQQKADEAEAQRRQQQRQIDEDQERQRRLKARLVEIAYAGATVDERRRVELVLRAQGRQDDPVAIKITLMKLRVAFES